MFPMSLIPYVILGIGALASTLYFQYESNAKDKINLELEQCKFELAVSYSNQLDINESLAKSNAKLESMSIQRDALLNSWENRPTKIKYIEKWKVKNVVKESDCNSVLDAISTNGF